MVGTAEQVRGLATSLRGEAQRLRAVAARVAATRSVAWESAAAQAFRDVVTARVLGLRRQAAELEEAADLLVVHAAGVEAAEAEVARVAGLVRGAGGVGRR